MGVIAFESVPPAGLGPGAHTTHETGANVLAPISTCVPRWSVQHGGG